MRVAQDVYLPDEVQMDAVGKIMDTTVIQTSDSDLEIRNKSSVYPRRGWTIGYAPEYVNEIEAMFRLFQRTESFLFKPPRPIDYTAEMQLIGTGDAVTVAYQLVLSETLGTVTVSKNVKHPRSGTVHVFIHGGSPDEAEVTFTLGSLGVVTLTSPPGSGVSVYASFLYDTPVRFDSTELNTTVMKHETGYTPYNPAGIHYRSAERMRLYSFDLSTANVKSVFTVTRRDDEVRRFTDHSTAITVDGETYEVAAGLKLFDIAEHNDGTPASTQLQISCDEDGPVTPQDVADKLYESAIVDWRLVDADNPTTPDFHFHGSVRGVSKPFRGQVVFDLRNNFGFPRSNLSSVYTVMCRWPFGGTMCGIPIMRPDMERSTAYAVGDTARFRSPSPSSYFNTYFEVTAITTGITASSAPSFNYTVSSTTVDGGVTWTARNAWERNCVIGTVVDRHNLTLTASPDPRAVDDWYNPGKIMFTTGKLKNKVFRIGGWTASGFQLTTYSPTGILTEVGDEAFIWPDCDKTIAMCVNKYNNARRHGGFPNYQGANAASQIL